MAESIEDGFQAAIDAGKINGGIICATDIEGNFIYEKTIGERTLVSGEKKPQQLDDVLFLASATKFITSIAALQCVEDGLLTLKGDLPASAAAELIDKKVITGFEDDGKTPILSPLDRHITLEMLLTHSSGVTYDFLNPLLKQWQDIYNKPVEGVRRPVEESFSYPLAFQPGSSWMYGPGLDWAGRIVERVTGQTLGERITERICKPLGITDAQFAPVTRQDMLDRMVDRNPQDPDGLGAAVVGGSGDMNKRTKGDFGGHGLFMTAADYIKVLHSILANDGKLLKPETVDDIFQQHLSPEAAQGHRAALDGPMGVFFRVGLDQKTKAGYGLAGLLSMESVEGWYGDRTLTWGGGLTFTWFIDRQNNICGLASVQSKLPVDGGLVEKLKNVFRHDIYQKHAEWKKTQGSS